MRRLWNRPADAVWSVSSISDTGIGNMNIATYVTAVSLDPKLMLVAVYKNTQTLQNVTVGKTILLQLLTQELAPVVRVCGQLSGQKIAKIPRLQKRYALAKHNALFYFTQSAGFLELEIEQLTKTSGDHVLLIGRVITAKNLVDAPILTTTYLKDHKYIR